MSYIWDSVAPDLLVAACGRLGLVKSLLYQTAD